MRERRLAPAAEIDPEQSARRRHKLVWIVGIDAGQLGGPLRKTAQSAWITGGSERRCKRTRI